MRSLNIAPKLLLQRGTTDTRLTFIGIAVLIVHWGHMFGDSNPSKLLPDVFLHYRLQIILSMETKLSAVPPMCRNSCRAVYLSHYQTSVPPLVHVEVEAYSITLPADMVLFRRKEMFISALLCIVSPFVCRYSKNAILLQLISCILKEC